MNKEKFLITLNGQIQFIERMDKIAKSNGDWESVNRYTVELGVLEAIKQQIEGGKFDEEEVA